MKYDTIIRNGTVIDPSSHIHGLYDVALEGGKIAGVFPQGQVSGSREIDAAGSYVAPGFIDLHTHIFRTVRGMGVKPDEVGVYQGVTTVVDAGSAGERDFPKFITDSVEGSRSEVLAWLNISAPGLTEGRSELADLNQLNIEKTLSRVRQHSDVIIGIKVRMSGSVICNSGIAPLILAKAAAQRGGLPVMVHIGNAPPELGDVLDVLEKGDVITHAFHGKPGGILDSSGRLIPQAEKALERGVLFDIGHGSSSFSFETMRKSKKRGIHPFSISTDIYTENKENGPVYSMALTMTKFLALGYSLREVIEWSTWTPAKVLRRSGSIGTLRTDTVADLTIFKVAEQPVTLIDSEHAAIEYDRVIQPQFTIKAGEIITCTP